MSKPVKRGERIPKIYINFSVTLKKDPDIRNLDRGSFFFNVIQQSQNKLFQYVAVVVVVVAGVVVILKDGPHYFAPLTGLKCHLLQMQSTLLTELTNSADTVHITKYNSPLLRKLTYE
jgi:hypothetical protein